MYQTTIKNAACCFGIGIHSGREVSITLKPAPAGTGIVFIRSDVKSTNNRIDALYSNVTDTNLCTMLSNKEGIKVSTIEHLMAAIWGCNIDNLFIEIDGPEVPIMDGSSKAFVFLLEYAGIKTLNAKRKFIKILKELSFNFGKSEYLLSPLNNNSNPNNLEISTEIEFDHYSIGNQKLNFSENFKEEIALARTFGFVHEVEYLQTQGLALGASLDNAIAVDKDGILNPEGLRFNNEFVRHKTLDTIGDLFTIGGRIVGKIDSIKPGHQSNNELLRYLLSSNAAASAIEIC